MAADATVRTVLAEGGTLSGTYTTPDNVALVADDLVLAPSPLDPTAADIYRVAAGPWTRETAITLFRWMDILVLEGDDYAGKAGWAGSIWTVATEGPYPRDGLSPLHFRVRQKQPHPSFGTGLTEELSGLVSLTPRTGVEGTYARIGGTINDRGVLTSVFETESGGAYLEGLGLAWDSIGQVTVLPGSAFVPGSGQVDLDAAAILTFPGTASLAANTWYFLYLHEANGTPQVEVSTQRPDDPYLGSARTKGGPSNADWTSSPDNTRRYVGAIRGSSTTNAVLRFVHRGNWVYYVADPTTATGSGGLRIAAAVTNTTYATRDASAVVPPTSDLCEVYITTNNTAGAEMNLSQPGTSGSFPQTIARPTGVGTGFARLSATQTFEQRNTIAGGSTDIAILSYMMER